jgi:SAM-dependent methyltransferase
MSSTIRRIVDECRKYGSACMTLVVRTRVRQWRKVAFAGTPSWDDRNQIMAGFVPAGSSVLDVGCGAQTLKKHLPPGCKYQPSDIVKSSPEVILCDLNAGVYPDTREYFDYVVCSGVFEYVRKPREFLQKIPRYGRIVLMSYNPLNPGGSKLDRLGNGWGWVNHFSREELENLLDEMGLIWHNIHTDKLAYIIYSIELRK